MPTASSRSLAGVPSVFGIMRATKANGAGMTGCRLERAGGGLVTFDLLNGFKRNEPVEKRMSLKFRSCIAATLLGAGALLLSPSSVLAQSDKNTGTQPAKDGAKDAGEALDQLIFRNGNKVEGKILSETETTITVKVIFAGISTETTYQKSEILEVKRGAVKVAPKGDADKDKKESATDSAAKTSGPSADELAGKVVDKNGKAIPEGVEKVCIVPFTGEFGRDVSATPVKEIMDELVQIQPDVVIFRFDNDFSAYGQRAMDFSQIGQMSYNFVFKASELDSLITDRFNYDGAFKKRPRTVAWIRRAMGPAAFLPFVFKEIYFTSDGFHGGIGGLENLFKGGQADEVVAEKQISLRLKEAEGLAIKGGHDERIIRAMSRGDTQLSYRMEGGKAVLLERMPQSPDEIVLKDDGPTNEVNRDTVQDIVRYKINDYLTLDAKTAQIIGFSNGTADTLDDLLFRMNITRNYAEVKTGAAKSLKDWGAAVVKAERDLRELWQKYQSVRVRDPGGYNERTAARTQRKTILRQMLSLFEKYEEALNPRMFGDAQSSAADMRILIDRIEQEQRIDRR